MSVDSINRCSRRIIDAAMRVHSVLGPGLLESAYEVCLAHELRKHGLQVLTQSPVSVSYDGVRMDIGYRVDMIVNNLIIVELKATAALLPVHRAQLLSYLRLSGHRLGLLLNFHELHLKNGIKRVVNEL